MKKCICILFLFAFATQAFSQRQNVHSKEGNALYRQGKFDKALVEYKMSAEANAADPVVNYNLGNAYFRNSQYEDAAKSFDNTAVGRNEAAIRQKAFYNKGVSLSKQNKLEESIDAYKNALKLNPADQDARINLQKALLELNKRKPPQQENKDNQKKKQDKKDQKRPPPQSNLTKKQVEQLLKALQQREQQVQQKMQSKNRIAGQQEKDW